MIVGISSGARAALLGTTALSLLLSPVAGYAQALPSGGTVTHGEATISQSGSSLLVTQSSHNAILNWNSFSIGGGASAHFDNGSGATLNRVTGNLPSAIDGTLTATGSLYLVNPAGIAVGTGGMVRTGGSFVASTHDVSDAAFLAGGDMVFAGTSTAGVVNEGVIASLGGDVVLTARRVENAGTILAPEGDVGLLAGYEVLLRDLASDDGRFAVRVGGADTEVVNTGTIAAANAELRANGGNVYALAGNTQGIITATGVKKQGGRIFLTAGNGGSVTATQRMVARPAQQAASLPQSVPVPQERPASLGGIVRISADRVTLGGEIDVSGDTIPGGTIIAVAKEQLSLTENARLDASGADGGLILLGGDYQGGADPQNTYWHEAIGTTQTTLVAGGASIVADGSEGAGGNVVVWGDDHTGFAGTISATGVTRGGDAEVSGKATLSYSGFADLRASDGAFGTLLLDPYNVTISNGAQTTGVGFTANGNDSVINATTLMAALGAANVTVSTGAGGAQNGDITVAAALSWNSAGVLTLDAAGGIAINAAITAQTGGLTLQSGGTITTGANGAVDVARFTLASGNWVQNTSTLPTFSATDFRITGGSFLRATGGDGVAGDPYLLTDIYGVQGMATHLLGHFALAGDIDASGTAQWWGGLGFVPVGRTNQANSFQGSFDGRGHAISGLTIDRPDEDYAGLFGYTSGATIANVGLTGGSVTGSWYVGGLVGRQLGGSIAQSYATGAVSGRNYVGGLVARQLGGSIAQSYATGAVAGLNAVGGLVGLQDGGSIEQSYATGAVQGSDYVGGLVGWQDGGSIAQSYATGAVAGTGNAVGGLVGYQLGSITQSYATGAVQGSDNVGGLVGYQLGSIAQSYATGAVAGTGNAVGGLVGYQLGSITQSYATGAVSGRDYVGGLVGYQQSGSITQSYATGAVRGSAYVGGLVGYRWAGSIADSFWDMETTEQDEAVGNIGSALGATGLTTAQARQASSYAGWDFDTVWYQERDLRPMLRAFAAPDRDGDGVYEISNLYQLQLMDAWRDRNYVLIRDIDASATDATLPGFDAAGIWSAQGFAPVGRTDQANSFQGSLDGQGHVISGLTIDRSGEDYAGLFGRTFDATIANVGLEGGSVTGRTFVGGLVGVQSGGSIAQSYATGAVAGLNAVGGLVGAQDGGSIAQSYATGAVEGTLDVGGLVGYQQSGSITQSYATGAVEGTHRVGGLVGLQGGGSIAQSYATGAVEGSNFVGGLVGLQDGGSIEQSYATGAVSGRDYVGGLVGRQLGGSITQSYATGAVSGRDYVGGLVGYQQSGSITQSYATGAVAGDWYIGGLVGYQWGGSIADSFWDRNTTQQDEAVGNIGSASGATGLTTAQMQDPFTFIDAGWDFAAIWGKSSLNENGGYMMLRGVGPGTLYDDYVRVAAVDLSRVYGSSNPALAPHVTIAGVGAANVSVGWGSAVGPQANAGAYAFTAPGVLDISTGSPGGVYVDYGSGTLTVTPRAITVTASNLSRLYGEANPALTFGPIGGDGLASFHADLAAAGFGLVTAAGMQSDVGSYAIDLTGANGNYDVTFTPGTLTVTPRAITVTADDLRKLLGQADPALTWSITGGSLASFDTEAGVFGGDLMRDPGEGVGTYSIRQGTLVANSNYDVTFVDGTLTIAPVAVSVASLFERALPLSLQADPTEGGALVLCDTGVLPEAECAAYPHPANRGLAHVGFAQ